MCAYACTHTNTYTECTDGFRYFKEVDPVPFHLQWARHKGSFYDIHFVVSDALI